MVSQGVRVVDGLGAAGLRRHVRYVDELRGGGDDGGWGVAPGLRLPHLSNPARIAHSSDTPFQACACASPFTNDQSHE